MSHHKELFDFWLDWHHHEGRSHDMGTISRWLSQHHSLHYTPSRLGEFKNHTRPVPSVLQAVMLDEALEYILGALGLHMTVKEAKKLLSVATIPLKAA